MLYVLREVRQRGHEVALSGEGGPSLRDSNANELREALRRSRAIVEEACGCRVVGYRRSDVHLRPEHLGALEVLAEEGFLYDSSVSPAGLAFVSQPGAASPIYSASNPARSGRFHSHRTASGG